MLKWIICLQKIIHIWINYKLKRHWGWKNAYSFSISVLIFSLACIYLFSSSVTAQCHQCVSMKTENDLILSGSTWQRQALWATDWPLFAGESTLWAFDWPPPEERLSISDWLGGVIFHLNASQAHRHWQEPPLYSKCVNVSFRLLLNAILWALMGSCRVGGCGWAQ